MTRHTVRILVVTLVVLGACPLPSGETQTLDKNAAYWQSYVAAMRRNDTLKVRLIDGPTLRGRLIDTTPEEMLIRRKRAFRRGSSSAFVSTQWRTSHEPIQRVTSGFIFHSWGSALGSWGLGWQQAANWIRPSNRPTDEKSSVLSP